MIARLFAVLVVFGAGAISSAGNNDVVRDGDTAINLAAKSVCPMLTGNNKPLRTTRLPNGNWAVWGGYNSEGPPCEEQGAEVQARSGQVVCRFFYCPVTMQPIPTPSQP
jgi:hypothetical protein